MFPKTHPAQQIHAGPFAMALAKTIARDRLPLSFIQPLAYLFRERA
jgi:hypothetical protein